jgi:hypothetical protein
MRPHRRARSTAPALAAFLLSMTLVGCGEQGIEPGAAVDEPDRSTAERPSRSPRESMSPGPTSQQPTPTAAVGTGQPSASGSAPAQPSTTATQVGRPRLRDRLLGAEQVPGFNDRFRWTEGRTRVREVPDPFGTCHRFAMTSIGASKVVVRDYLPRRAGADGTASALVAKFPDTMTAKRAYAVLTAWRGQCEEELSEHPTRDVGPLRSVTVPRGVAGWYLLTYGPAGDDPESGYFDAQGLTRVGTRVAVLQMRSVGQDYSYPAGQEPMVTFTRRANGLL